jgi:hypothetical protein
MPWLNFSHDSKLKYSMKTMLCKYSNNCFNYDIKTLNYLSITYKKMKKKVKTNSRITNLFKNIIRYISKYKKGEIKMYINQVQIIKREHN